METHSHRDLIVWQRAVGLVSAIYALLDQYPAYELYGLTAQTRSAVCAIPSNIAEGRRRRTRKDYVRFLTYAYSSGSELESHIAVAKVVPFGKQIDFSKVDRLLEEVMRMLNTMIHKMNPR